MLSLLRKVEKDQADISNHLKRLRELEKTLDFASYTSRGESGEITLHLADGKKGYSRNLYRDDIIAVALTRFPDGGALAPHTHSENEYVLVITGKVSVTIDAEERVLYSGDCLVIDSNTPHGAIQSENTKILAITMPPSASWPK